MKNILLIGLGRFGRHMAQTLSDLHHQVLVIDKDEHKVQEAMSYVTNAEIGDATDPALIDALGVKDFDLCTFCFPAERMKSSIRRNRWPTGLPYDTVMTMSMIIPVCLPITPYMKQRSLKHGLAIQWLISGCVNGIA